MSESTASPSPTTNPPYYLLVSHLSLANTAPGAPSSSLLHPTIQYHYLDDSPLSLLPQHPDEHVLVLDYDPNSASSPKIQSISPGMIVTGSKAEEAPGAAADENDGKSSKMFIIETTSDDGAVNAIHGDRNSAQSVLAQFKQRNSILRSALSYPNNVQSSRDTNINSYPSQLTPSTSPKP